MTRRLKGVDRFSSPKRSTLCSKVLSEDEAHTCVVSHSAYAQTRISTSRIL
jgi:hypothetical protein